MEGFFIFLNLEPLPFPTFNHPIPYFPIKNYSISWKIPFLVFHTENISFFGFSYYKHLAVLKFLLDLSPTLTPTPPPSSSLSKSWGRIAMIPGSSFISESRFVLLDLSCTLNQLSVCFCFSNGIIHLFSLS